MSDPKIPKEIIEKLEKTSEKIQKKAEKNSDKPRYKPTPPINIYIFY